MNSEQQIKLSRNQSFPALIWLITAAMLCALPALGMFVAEISWPAFFEYPPRTLYIKHAPFSSAWWFFFAIVSIVLLITLAFMLKFNFRVNHRPTKKSLIAFFLLLSAWLIAWQRFPAFQQMQPHTFLFVWLSYVIFMNVLLFELHGSCPLLTSTARYLLSFAFSAFFWWVFEFLNRFTQNWHYLGVEDFTPLSYSIFATLSFSTILPSIWVTKDFLSKTLLLARKHNLELNFSPAISFSLILACILILISLPIFPDYLFSSIWLLPIILLISFQTFRGRRVNLHEAALWGASGLWCGILWELWNWHSLAKWIYFVPFVQRYHIFEMPLVGYAGYLPFGILCGMAIQSLEKQED